MSAREYFHHSNDRVLADDYDGEVLVWDIDKTYLDTAFSSWRGLASIPFEFAIDKQTIPGAVPVLRALRHGPEKETRLTPLYFVSGSPPQLRRVIERRMTLDGVQYDGISFKDQLGLILAGRFGDVKGQLGYKLQALLRYREAIPAGARWLCFGDDVESDAEVFALFGAVCGGMPVGELEKELQTASVHRDDRHRILARCEALGAGDDPVVRIFIHLARGTDPARFTDPRVVATRSYLQTALVLAHEGQTRPEAVAAVAKELRRRGRSESELRDDVEDAVWRLGVPMELSVLAGGR